MKLLEFVPIKLTALLVLGILLGKQLDPSITFSFWLTGFLLALLGVMFFGLIKSKSTLYELTVFLVVISLGLLSTSLSKPENYRDHYSHFIKPKSQLWSVKIRKVHKPTSWYKRYMAEVQSVDAIRTRGKILLSIKRDVFSQDLEVDQELLVWDQVTEVTAPLNPHQFNYKAYLNTLRIAHNLRLKSTSFIPIDSSRRTALGITARLRNTITSKLEQEGFKGAELAIIQALLLGQRTQLDETIYENYKNAGAVHILAVSGLHIGILLMILQWLLRPLEWAPKGKTIKLVLIVVFLWLYAFIAGFSPSVIRAVSMFSFVAYALYLNRPSNTYNVLALSMFFVLLVFDPMMLFQVGFQMSYAAVFFILWIYPKLQQLWRPRHFIIRKGWQLLSVSIAAQIGVLPISLYYFHQFPGLFFISNLVIVPFLGFVLGIGILVIALSLVNGLPPLVSQGFYLGIKTMNAIVKQIGQQEAFIFTNVPFDGPQLVLLYVLISCATWFLTKRNFKWILATLLSIVAFQLYAIRLNCRTARAEQVLLWHRMGNSVISHKEGSTLSLYSKDPLNNTQWLQSYTINERIRKVQLQPLGNSYLIGGQQLVVIDRSTPLPKTLARIDILLLSQSPKINLERYLTLLNPSMVLVDGSNYPNFIARWQATCKKRKLPFHYTGEKGAYLFELKAP